MGSILGLKDPVEKEMAIHSSILAWEMPWTVVPGDLESMGLQELDTKTKQQPVSTQRHNCMEKLPTGLCAVI